MNTRPAPITNKHWFALVLALLIWLDCATAAAPLPDELIRATNNSDLEQMKTLLKKGVSVNASDERGRTALMWAVLHGHLEAIKLLQERGADINARDNLGKTPLIWAVWEGRFQVAELLLRRRADVNAKSFGGRTALMEAAARDHHIEDNWYFGLWPWIRTILSGTFFGPRYPSAEEDPQIIKLLLQKGADVNTKDKEGWTALNRARYRGATEIVKQLKGAGAKE